MLAGTVVYVNAGTQLGKLESLSGILSPSLIGSFALLGIFPLLTNKIVEAIKADKVYAQWVKPSRFDNNIVVIGAGSDSLVTVYIAAAVKAKVTLIENLVSTHKYNHAPKGLLWCIARYHDWRRW
jgi:hypothetical protein